MSVEEAQATGHAAIAVLRPRLGGMPDRAVGGKPHRRRALYSKCCSIIRESTACGSGTRFGSRFQRVVALKSGDLDAGSRLLRTGLDEIAEPDFSFRFLTGLVELAEALGHAGRIAEGLAMVEAGDRAVRGRLAHARAVTPQGRAFAVAEHSRGRGNGGGPLPAGAGWGAPSKRHCHGSCARRRASPACCAITAAPPSAIACLQPVYDRFTEGFGTADLIAAKQLLDELGDARSWLSQHAPIDGDLQSRSARSGSLRRSGFCSRATSQCGSAAAPLTFSPL